MVCDHHFQQNRLKQALLMLHLMPVVLPQVDTVVFDKTGTLTAGRPIVAGITMLQQPTTAHSSHTGIYSSSHTSTTSSNSSSSSGDISPSLMLQLAAAVERQATHPVAKALVAAAAADRKAAAAAASSSSHQDAAEQQQLLQERRESHAAAGTSNTGSGSADKHHHFWQHKHISSKGAGSSSSYGSSFVSSEAAAALASGRQLEPDSGTFTQEPGSGAVAVVAGHKVSVGTLEWVQRHGAQLGTLGEQQLQTSNSVTGSGSQHEPLTGHTQVYVGVDDVVVGLVDVADVIRPDARSTIQELHEQGITTVMLSGGCSVAVEEGGS